MPRLVCMCVCNGSEYLLKKNAEKGLEDVNVVLVCDLVMMMMLGFFW